MNAAGASQVSQSMEPAIPDGAYCLCGSPKRYESEKAVSEDGTWRHVRVLLKPVNRDFQPIELTCDDEGSVDVVAEMLEVLG